MDREDRIYEDVHNYTKYKLVEMLINRLQEDKIKFDNLNSIEDLADDVLKVLSIAGLKYYSELKRGFKNENRN